MAVFFVCALPLLYFVYIFYILSFDNTTDLRYNVAT